MKGGGTMIEVTTSLKDVFKDRASHTIVIARDGALAGMIHMRDLLGVYLEHGSLDNKTVGEYMNETPITIRKTDNLLKPARLFVEHKIKSVLMIDDETGEVSNLGPQQLIEELPSDLLGFHQPVSRVMVSDPVAIQGDVTLKDAVSTLVARHFSCLPVCSAEGELQGILSESDLLKAVMTAKDDATLVSELMTSSPVTIEEHANLKQTWQVMCDHGVMKIFVVGVDGSLKGLVTATDVLISLCQSLLSTFAIYHCPEDTDLMVEWRNRGMIMAASDSVAEKLGCEVEDLIGMHWGQGFSEDDHEILLTLPKTESINIDWEYAGKATNFHIRRDIEQAAMWWKLN